jgi:hypothetical protein
MGTLFQLPTGQWIWEHIKDYYYSEKEKIQPNTYVLNSDRDIRVDVGSDLGAIIGRLPAGTLLIIDEEQVEEKWGWKRIIGVKDLPGYLPAEIREKQEELYPDEYWKRKAYVDWSGLGTWPPLTPPPLPVEPKELYEKVWGIKLGEVVVGVFKIFDPKSVG